MIKEDVARRVLEKALKTGGDFSEIYMENTDSSSLSMIGDKLETAVSGLAQGAGIRVFLGNRAVYVYTNDTSENGLLDAAEKAASAIEGTGSGECAGLRFSATPQASPVLLSPANVPAERKVEKLSIACRAAKGYDPLISQVRAGLIDWSKEILIANSEGLFVRDSRTYTRLTAMAIASREDDSQTGSEGPGFQMGFEMFDGRVDPEIYGKEAARTAVTMLNAPYAPAGKMPVVIGNGFGGVIFHEACGHSLEATAVAKSNSVFTGRLGQQIASPVVTAIDDGTLPNEWGSSNIDDEGTPTRRNVLIQNGILQTYLVDKLNGRRMGMEPNGCSRRQSYRFAPTSRMSNTFIAPGSSTDEEIISSMADGLFCRKMGGGSVNTETGDFNFAVAEAYLVKNGVIQTPVRGATLIGKGAEVLLKIDMVGQDMRMGQGMCGSLSGSIPANVGQPMIRVSEMLVGGREGGRS